MVSPNEKTIAKFAFVIGTPAPQYLETRTAIVGHVTRPGGNTCKNTRWSRQSITCIFRRSKRQRQNECADRPDGRQRDRKCRIGFVQLTRNNFRVWERNESYFSVNSLRLHTADGRMVVEFRRKRFKPACHETTCRLHSEDVL